jgi:hypothetical protein
MGGPQWSQLSTVVRGPRDEGRAAGGGPALGDSSTIALAQACTTAAMTTAVIPLE